eukprot:gene33630-43465_t
MSNDVVGKILYRSLLRLGKKFDSNPGARCLIYRDSNYHFSPPYRPYQKVVHASKSVEYYGSFLDILLGERNFYHPLNQSYESADLTTLESLIRNEFSIRTDHELTEVERKDVAFAALRKLSSIWNSYQSSRSVSSESPAKSHDKKLKVQKVEEEKVESVEENVSESIRQPSTWQGFSHFQSIQVPLAMEKVDKLSCGVTLVAHPLLPGPLRKACVLILEHSAAHGSYGLIINRPTKYLLEDSVKNLPKELLRFKKNPKQLYFGANLAKVPNQVEKYPNLVSSCQFYVGCGIWAPGDLEEQMRRGIWVGVHTPVDELLAAQMDNMGEDFKGFNDVPSSLSKSRVESADWK